MDSDELLTRAQAVDRVLALRKRTFEGRGGESVSLDELAGRTLAEPIVSGRDLPSHSHATMDGFALNATANYPLRIVDEVFPEDTPPQVEADEAVRIATGAPLPEGANAVLKREDATVEDGVLSGDDVGPGTYVYERGSNVATGETLFDAGERLAPKDAILLRDVGLERVPVHQPLSVGILATGTEIHEGRSDDLDSPMLAGLVRSWGHEATLEGTVPDEYDRVEKRIGDLAGEHDVVITTGGTSVGHKDYVVRALNARGTVRFHGVRIRPGKPLALATLPDQDALAFAVPGKPVGAHTIATAVVRPFFTGDGTLPSVEASIACDLDIGREGFEYWVPVVLDSDDAVGPFKALPFGHVDSPLDVYDGTFDPSVLSSSTRAVCADGFFVTDDNVAAGDRIRVVLYPTLE